MHIRHSRMEHPLSQTPFPMFCDIVLPMLAPHQIAELRKRMGLSQSEMAAALGIASRLTLSQWETGVSVPGGPVMRFLTLLNRLSDSDLHRIMRHLDSITKTEESKK